MYIIYSYCNVHNYYFYFPILCFSPINIITNITHHNFHCYHHHYKNSCYQQSSTLYLYTYICFYISINRFIPPHTFVPVALNINTTYIEIDYCEITGYLESNPSVATYNCNIKTDRVYGSQYLFPRSYDVVQTKDSICKADGITILIYICKYIYIYIYN